MATEAQTYAIAQHADQKYGLAPYWYHLREVVGVLAEHGHGGVLYQRIGWLHDVIEDTPATWETLATKFGWDVACAVAFVSDAEGHNRKTRKAATVQRWAEHRRQWETEGQASWYPMGAVVKVADRIANLRNSIQTRPDKVKMYRGEHEDFREALYSPGVAETLWAEVDHLVGTGELLPQYRVGVRSAPITGEQRM